MMEGVLRHCTDMEINHQYVDSHDEVRWPLRSVMCWGSICCRA